MNIQFLREAVIHLETLLDSGFNISTQTWEPPLILRRQIEGLMNEAAKLELAHVKSEQIELPNDKFAQRGLWHRAANVVNAHLKRMSKQMQDESGYEFAGGLPVGDWSHAGLMSAMASGGRYGGNHWWLK